MNRINRLFEQKKNGILSIYFTAGFPRIGDTIEVIEHLQAAGVDMIEIGIPFSDPMADGVVIQQSSSVALNNGMTLSLLFDQLTDVRKTTTIPLVMMGYLNPIMQYGVEPFCAKCAELGIDGVIVPDLPFHDYIKEYKSIADRHGVKFIMLITPETSAERIELIDRNTDSFIYMVSTAATTGAQSSFGEATQKYFERINSMQLRNPRLIGFGISNKETLSAALRNANGAIIGSAFIKLLASSSTTKDAVTQLLRSIE